MRILPGAVLPLLLLGVVSGAQAGVKEDAKSAGKAVGEGFKEAGRAFKEAGKEVGHEVARASTAAARDVKRVTTDFWDRALAQKRKRVAELRRENSELKKR